jgi:non-specific serine/threonine protein kinase
MHEQQANFGERLREFRLRAGMSQAALAEQAGLTTAAVASLEQGLRRSPYARTLGALAEALQLSMEERARFTSSARVAPRPPANIEPGARPAPFEQPPRRSALIGREHDVASVRALLADTNREPTARLVTLTGIGGVGKTSLARAVANELRSSFEDRVWVIELAHVVEPARVPAMLGRALGLPDVATAEATEAVVAFLRGTHALLVLDNCEHLIDACANVVDSLLDCCPNIRVLATSREPLLIRGEQQIRVQPLPVPEEADSASIEVLADNPAVQLLVGRARPACPDFRLTTEIAPAVAQICIRLEGIPLALELAAANLTVLTAEQLVERLDDAFQVLGTRNRSTPARQRTLRATLDWSYELLTPLEQALIRRLGVFVGGFSLEAAECVCTGEDVRTTQVLELLARLVDKSLVVVQPSTSGRYRLVEPLRQYALQCLAARGENREFEQRHTAYYVALAGQAAPELSGPDQVAWLGRLDGDLDNLRATLHRVARMDDTVLELKLATALARYCEARGRLEEGRRWLENAIARARSADLPRDVLRDALFGAGRLTQWQADLEHSAALIQESVELSRVLRDDGAIAEGLAWLGTAYLRQGATEKATRILEESVAKGVVLGSHPGHATALRCMAVLLAEQGDLRRARHLLESGPAQCGALGDIRAEGMTLVVGGELALAEDRPAQAHTSLVDALRLANCVGDPLLALLAFERLAEVEATGGDAARAARWLGGTDTLRHRLGAPRARTDWRVWERVLSLLRAELGEAGSADALAAGRGVSLDWMLADVLSKPSTPPATASEPESNGMTAAYGRLSRREREVANLLRQECSDRAIATRLSITVGTAGLHVHRVLRKLELHSRWQVADWLDRIAVGGDTRLV